MANTKNIQNVEEITKLLGKAKSVYFTDYLGLNVEEITELRSEFFKANVEYRVTKNTLLKIAAKNNNIDGIDEFLNGPTAIALSYDDPVSPARILKTFTKNRKLPAVKGILFEGEVLSGKEFIRIADLPTKEQLLGQLAALLQAPLVKLAMTLKAPMMGVGNVLNNLKKQKS